MNTNMTEEDLELESSDSNFVLDSVAEAIRLLDKALNETGNRGIVSAGEMSDLLLDVRLVLAPLIA